MNPQPFDNDAQHFPILQAVAADPSSFGKLKRKDVDALALEVTKALRRSSVPESNVSFAERQVNALMLGCIGTIDSRLTSNSSNPKAGATLMLFRRVMCTPDNLTALCQIADPTIRTGHCRCHAIWHLHQLRQMNFCWKIRLVDGSKRSFLLAVTEALAGVLDARIDPGPLTHQQRPACICVDISWENLPHSLAACTDPPEDVVSMLLKYDWPTILMRPDAKVTPNSTEVTYYAMLIFHLIHKSAVRLLAHDETSQKARELLASLGRCSNALLQKYLKDIVAKKVWSRDGEGDRFGEMAPIINSINSMLHCLVPLPENDVELDSLVRRGRESLLGVFMECLHREVSSLAQDPDRSVGGINLCNYVLDLMDDDRWHALKQESDATRWLRFKRHYLASPDTAAADHSAYTKGVRKLDKKEMKKSIDLSRGEICANCFVLEKKLRYKLKKCTRCMQIKYCSRTCQVEHWKKAHKAQCHQVKQSDYATID